ncbi:MAG: GGDEF domain-containing protein [Gammaproteobacteria bacterium]|nr:MAG: GGDEF domain-containing protein [Gammaproteobacteria bacterium]
MREVGHFSDTEKIGISNRMINNLMLQPVLEEYSVLAERYKVADSFMVALHDDMKKSIVCKHVKLHGSLRSVKSVFENYPVPIEKKDPFVHAFNHNALIKLDKDQISLSEEYDQVSKVRFERWNIKEMVCCPISYHGEPFGVFIGFNHKSVIDEELLGDFLLQSQFFAPYLYNANVIESYMRRDAIAKSAIKERQQFLELTSQLNALKSEDQIYQVISAKILDLYSFDICSVTGYSEDDNILSVRATSHKKQAEQEKISKYLGVYGDISYRPSPEEGATATAYANNIFFQIKDAQELKDLPMAPADRRGIEEAGVRSVLHVPIRYNKEPIGVLSLVTLSEVVSLDEEDIDVAVMLGEFIGTAVVNAKQYSSDIEHRRQIAEFNEKLQKRVEHLDIEVRKDKLTAVMNRKGGEEILIKHTNDSTTPLSILYLDIDHFKKFNDTYGHDAGDECLIHFARKIEEFSRSIDSVCRYGGEEFIIILPKCGIDNAMIVAERIRAGVESSVLLSEGREFSVTTSIGCAEWDLKEDFMDTINRADQALLKAKESGRNIVINSAEIEEKIANV